MNHIIFRVLSLVAALAIGLLSGCGARPGDVSGAVKYNGKPLTMGSVMFSVAGHPPVTANIDEQGHYAARGVPAGAATVTVYSPDPQVMAARAGKKGAGEMAPEDLKERKQKELPETQRPRQVDPKKWFAIPQQYADPKQSGLSLKVNPGQNDFSIDLK